MAEDILLAGTAGLSRVIRKEVAIALVKVATLICRHVLFSLVRVARLLLLKNNLVFDFLLLLLWFVSLTFLSATDRCSF